MKEGAYRVDNVKHRTDGVQPDVKIYLSSEYTIEYYVNTAIDNNLSSTTDIYVAYREDANGRTNDSATATSDSTRFWTNPDTDIKTSVTLPEYSEAGMSFDGWYLGKHEQWRSHFCWNDAERYG